MKHFLLKQIVQYLSNNAQNVKFIKRIDNNIIIIEFNNKNVIYIDISKGNSTIFKCKNSLSSKKDFKLLNIKMIELAEKVIYKFDKYNFR